MPTTNPSKITAFMVSIKELLETVVPDIGTVVILGQQDVVQELELATDQGSGQAVSIIAIGGQNSQPESRKGLSVATNFQVAIYDAPNLRDHYARHGYEITEDVMRALQGQTIENLNNAHCKDLTAESWFLEQDEGFDIYTVAVEADLTYTPLTAAT